MKVEVGLQFVEVRIEQILGAKEIHPKVEVELPQALGVDEDGHDGAHHGPEGDNGQRVIFVESEDPLSSAARSRCRKRVGR